MNMMDACSDPELKQIKVLIADDHQIVGDAVARMLETDPKFEASVVACLDEAITALCSEKEYHLLMLDVRMPGVHGVDSIDKLMKRAGNTKVVLFSGETDRRFADAAIKLGVRGIIPKSMPLNSLASAIGLVISGQVFIPADFAQEKPEACSMTDQEKQILKLVAEGMTNKEIANLVANTEVNIKMHMRIISKKLDARNRAHAVMVARQLGVI